MKKLILAALVSGLTCLNSVIAIAQPVHNPEEKHLVLLYPNPAQEELMLSHLEGILKIQIMDASGKIVSTTENTGKEAKIQLESLSAGIYTISLIAEDEVILRKFVIEN